MVSQTFEKIKIFCLRDIIKKKKKKKASYTPEK